MKYLWLWVGLALMITACSASGSVSASEPLSDNSAASQKARADYALKQAQQQEADAHAAAVNETAQAIAANNVLSLSEKATAQALNVARAQLVMTADAVNFPSTQAAAVAQQTAQSLVANATADARLMLQVQQQAQTTATAQAMAAQQTAQAIEARATVDARAMLAAQQQSEATATAQAMQRENASAQQAANTTKWQNELMSWLIPFLAVLALGMTLLLAALFVSGLLDATSVQRSLENQRLTRLESLYLTPNETIVYTEGLPAHASAHRFITSGPVVQSAPIIDSDVPASAVLLSYDDQVLEDRAEAREESARYKLAMKLIRDSINHVGAASNRIPPSAQLNWPEGAWTIAVAILRPFGVENLPGVDGGTFLVGQYPTLQALYNAIGARMLELLSPTP